jgi:hypothetical protein
VVAVTDAIVNKGTVVVKFLNTLLAVVAVEGTSGFDDSAIEAEVV